MVYNSQGFFDLKTAEDLREKARHDLNLMREVPRDPYRAFNFFVTARHVPEWKWDKAKARQYFRSTPVMLICRHIADGAKHFSLDAHHTQVEELTSHDGAFFRGGFSSLSFATPNLYIELNPADAAAAQLPKNVDAVTLADVILAELNKAF